MLKMQLNMLGLGGGDERVQEIVGFGGIGFFVGCFFLFFSWPF